MQEVAGSSPVSPIIKGYTGICGSVLLNRAIIMFEKLLKTHVGKSIYWY